ASGSFAKEDGLHANEGRPYFQTAVSSEQRDSVRSCCGSREGTSVWECHDGAISATHCRRTHIGAIRCGLARHEKQTSRSSRRAEMATGGTSCSSPRVAPAR